MMDVDNLAENLDALFSEMSEDDKKEVAYRLAWFDDAPYENFAILTNILYKYQKVEK